MVKKKRLMLEYLVLGTWYLVPKFTIKPLLTLLALLLLTPAFSQSIPAGMPGIEEYLLRRQLTGELDSTVSFAHRPLQVHFEGDGKIWDLENWVRGKDIKLGAPKRESFFGFMPIRNTTTYNSGRPYGYGNGLMVPNVGGQNYSTGGVYGKYKFLHFQFMPEFVIAQNLPYEGFSSRFEQEVDRARYYFWNTGDSPERFGSEMYSKFWWGQSKISAQAGSVEAGISTQQLWWGPGQFNSLIFSNNAPGFLHFSINTTKPIQTPIGNFEGQMVMGRLESSGFMPSQHSGLNARHSRAPLSQWRYLNGLNITYQPKWIPGLFVGLNRTFQQFGNDVEAKFGSILPVFDPFPKATLAGDLALPDYDSLGMGRGDQQASFFIKYLLPKANLSLYAEYGRRDHAYNWREFLVNPDHARAYLMGIHKLVPLPRTDQYIQLRGEMVQQLESADRFVRYGPGGGMSWHHHSQLRGFSHFGQALGVGIGDAGSNMQTMEVSWVKNLNKVGLLLERRSAHQNFYYRAFGQQEEVQPWVDLGLGVLVDYQWDKFLISTKLQGINALNYQWQLEPNSSVEFPQGKDLFSVYAKVDLVYFLR